MTTQPFEALPMPRKDIPQPIAGNYRVYTDARRYVRVEASSALEALQVSGLKSASRIERESFDVINVLSPSLWMTDNAPAASVQASAASAEVAATGEKETVLIEGQPQPQAPASPA